MRHNCRNIFCLLVLLFITAPGCVSPNEPFLEIQDIKRTLLLENGEQTTISTEWFEIKDKLPASPNGRNYQFKRITTEDGLSQNIVRTVIQDRFGYMWIGTDGGLNRFDGDGFILYENDVDDPTSLSSNQVWAILETRDGIMWIGTDDGLNRLDPGSRDFTRFFHDPQDKNSLSNNRIRVLLEDSRGFIWIGTWGGGLDRYDPQSDTFNNYSADDSRSFVISSDYVRTIAEDLNGELWVGTLDGLNRLNVEMDEFITYRQSVVESKRYLSEESNFLFERDISFYRTGRLTPADDELIDLNPALLVSNEIHALAVDGIRNKLWIGTASGLDCLDLKSGVFEHFRFSGTDQTSLSSNLILSLLLDQNSLLWVGTNNGLNEHLGNGKFNRYQNDNREPDNRYALGNQIVNTIFQDESGSFWIGTSGNGVNQFSQATDIFLHAYHDAGNMDTINGDMVWSAAEDTDIGFWVGTNVGIDRYNLFNGRFEHYSLIQAENEITTPIQVYAIQKDFNADTWLGTSDGLFLYDPESRSFKEYMQDSLIAQEQSVPFKNVIILDIAAANRTDLWLGTFGSGLIHLNTETGEINTHTFDNRNPESISSDFVSTLLVDDSGRLFAGTRGSGLNILATDSNRFTRLSSDPDDPSSLSENNINDLFESADGSIWVATMGGLNRMDSNELTFQVFNSTNSGLSSDVTYAVLQDEKGEIWVSTNHGIMRMNPVNQEVRNYDFNDGLQSNEFNPGAALLASEGWMFFGGINGLTIFHPDLLLSNPMEPTVSLAGLTQNRVPLIIPDTWDNSEPLVLRWPRNYFEFKSSVHDYIDAEDNRVAYRLHPLETDWKETKADAIITYENIRSGNYALLLKGANASGVWSQPVRAADIRVLPPLWETNQFRISVVGSVIIAAALIVRVRLRNERQYSKKLKQEVAERTNDIERRRKVAEGLREILMRINSNHSIAETLDFVVCQANRILSTSAAMIFARDEKGIISMQAAANDSSKDIPMERLSILIDKWIAKIEKSRPGLRDHMTVFCDDFPLVDNTRCMASPIYSLRGVHGGLMVLENPNRVLEADDLEVLQSLADQAALAIENDRLRRTAEEAAVTTERVRIARDLHDAITQTLFSANLIAESLPEVWRKNEQDAASSIANLQALNKSALAEMRTLLLELRPDVVADIPMKELLAELCTSLTGRTSAKVSLTVEDGASLPRDIHLHFYRVAQEAVTNIIKHARPKRVKIQYVSRQQRTFEEKRIFSRLEITDDGRGFDLDLVAGAHFGLRGMEERASDTGAGLKIESEMGKGTNIILEWEGRQADFEECE